MSVTETKTASKPFLVEGFDGKNIFRVVEMTTEINRGQIERLLEQLPILFNLRTTSSMSEDVNEPIEVRVTAGVVYFYPPRRRVVGSLTLDAWQSEKLIQQMHVHEVMDSMCPGRGQLRSCIHLDPKIFGIEGWPESAAKELELDFHVFPESKTQELRPVPPTFGKHEVRKLLDLVVGRGKHSSELVEKVRAWRGLIIYAVESMRSMYVNPDATGSNSVAQYYERDWKAIADASNDTELAKALEDLRTSIEME